MAKPKLGESLGGKIEAQGVLGLQNRTTGKLRVDLGSVWGCQGRALEKFRDRFFLLHFQGEKIMNICQTNPFLPVRPKPVPNNLFDSFVQ